MINLIHIIDCYYWIWIQSAIDNEHCLWVWGSNANVNYGKIYSGRDYGFVCCTHIYISPGVALNFWSHGDFRTATQLSVRDFSKKRKTKWPLSDKTKMGSNSENETNFGQFFSKIQIFQFWPTKKWKRGSFGEKLSKIGYEWFKTGIIGWGQNKKSWGQWIGVSWKKGVNLAIQPYHQFLVSAPLAFS